MYYMLFTNHAYNETILNKWETHASSKFKINDCVVLVLLKVRLTILRVCLTYWVFYLHLGWLYVSFPNASRDMKLIKYCPCYLVQNFKHLFSQEDPKTRYALHQKLWHPLFCMYPSFYMGDLLFCAAYCIIWYLHAKKKHTFFQNSKLMSK